MRARFLVLATIVTSLLLTSTLPAAAAAASGGGADGTDDRVSQQTYVRHDLGTDATIEVCNGTDPEDFGNLTQNNEPFSVVSPTNPDLVIAGWNDYCSDWMGLGFSTDGGETWTSSLVPELRGRHVRGRTGDPRVRSNELCERSRGCVQRGRHEVLLRRDPFNGFAGPKTNSDVWVARYDVREPGDPNYAAYPLDFLGITQVDRGPAAANFLGRFQDKEMIEVDRSPTSPTKATSTSAGRSSPGSANPGSTSPGRRTREPPSGTRSRSGNGSPARVRHRRRVRR